MRLRGRFSLARSDSIGIGPLSDHPLVPNHLI